MNPDEIRYEIKFGLENLQKLYETITLFSSDKADERLKVSALAYECVGYYNALEHLIIRILKYLQIERPEGAFSHRDILKKFELVLKERNIYHDVNLINHLENLMAFRHVATNIYGFLIDWHKLESVITDIMNDHNRFKSFFQDIVKAVI